jgi:hypothetical protein
MPSYFTAHVILRQVFARKKTTPARSVIDTIPVSFASQSYSPKHLETEK